MGRCELGCRIPFPSPSYDSRSVLAVKGSLLRAKRAPLTAPGRSEAHNLYEGKGIRGTSHLSTISASAPQSAFHRSTVLKCGRLLARSWPVPPTRNPEEPLSQASAEALRFVQPLNDLAPGVEFDRHTFGVLVEKWRKTVARTLRPETIRSYDWALGRILPRFGKTPVSEVERADVEEFLIDAKEEGLSSSAVETIKRRLKALFSCAVDWEWIPISPVRGRFRLGIPRTARPKTILARSLVEALIMLLKPPYDAMVLLAVYAGLRKGELSGLKWRDDQEALPGF